MASKNGNDAGAKDDEMSYAEQHYFHSYDHFGIHEEMLKDKVRTLSYRRAIYDNKALFQDKVVLDVGCGTGILSMFAAKAGAKHVIGVDMSSIIELAKEVVAKNGLADKVTLIRGKMEEIKLPFPKVDIIISEWMGYFLLYESMLDTVLYARDHYLVEGGIILPDKANLVVAGLEDAEYKDEKIGFWDDVYGFDYSPLKKIALTEPLVDIVESQAIPTERQTIFEIDIATVTPQELAFSKEFSLKVLRNDFVHALVAWFDIEFSKGHKPVKFSTGPFTSYTHWKQTVLYLPEVLTVSSGDVINGKLTSTPSKRNPRDLEIVLDVDFKSKSNPQFSFTGKSSYYMG